MNLNPLGYVNVGDPGERFWDKVVKIPFHECWEWTGKKMRGGYGAFRLNGRAVAAHRIAYELVVAHVPANLSIDHLCRNPGCVNPHHLEPVTLRENILRGGGPAALNAKKTACVHGHGFTPENTYLTPRGTRACRACSRASVVRYAERKRSRP